ncbi:f-box/tpr repeat protein pof3 [Holotrichia oblita]|uniref:F-box/tpr repeat protein pof3 n=1 Tax=Holotrichia oblita TaxID=644536 RepID=A0ACB9SS18_HOLOL|nr:f-box/tpr repeat protein pof3 [Holotrichia oblita]
MSNFECFAEGVLDYTARYNHNMTISYGPENLTGKPVKYPDYGDCVDTYMLRKYGRWWIDSENSQKHYMTQDIEEIPSQDYITLRFEAAVIPTAVVIYETYNPGSVVRIWGRHTGEQWIILWEGKPEKCPQTSRNFSPPIRQISDLINEIRLDLNHSLLNYQTALDAVLLAGRQPTSELQRKLLSSRLLTIQMDKSIKNESNFDENLIDNVFTTLPYDVIVHIFKYLDIKTLCRCAQVSKLWLAATLDPRIYSHLSLKRYWHKVDNRLLEMFMERCRALRKLDLSWCGNDNKISEEVFARFLQNSCKHLTHLSLCHSKFITNTSLKNITQYCRDLTEIRLHDCNLGENKSQFKDLAGLNKLITLDLYASSIHDDELIYILQNTPYLQHINLDMCSNLKRLDSITEIVSQYNRNLVTWSSWKIERMTAIGVRNLAKCNRLRELDLGWCFISSDPEDCLEHIAQGCKDLRRTGFGQYFCVFKFDRLEKLILKQLIVF